jgi:photosystem II stability/assembly factor-like uncharacterized protein
MRRKPLPFPLVLGGILAVGIATLLALPQPAPAEEATREQQIADLERQIQEITKKLEELKRQSPSQAKPVEGLPAEWVKQLNWRCIGPASMAGRIVAFSVFEADPTTYWVATASGGLLKTVNNGTTFEHQFDHEATVCIGDVCVAPSDKNVVYVGTGENNPRNSVSYGDGVYKSTDGGKTWKNVGLTKSFQIGRIAVHPKNPDVVYVGALGRLYGPNEERGLFKSTDGGKTWNKILYVDDKTGVIDMVMNPADPETLLVATWERKRDGYDSHRGDPPLEDGYDAYDPIKKWGPGSGIHKTTDGGKTWKKLTKGLPASPMGRIGLDFYRKNPNTVFAIIDCQKIGMGTPPPFLGIQSQEVKDVGVRVTRVEPNRSAAKAGIKTGDIIKTIDKKEIKNPQGLLEAIDAHKTGDVLAMQVLRDKETKDVSVTLEARPPQGSLGVQFGFAEEGLQVTDVTPNGAGEKAGLKSGDVIVAIDKEDLSQSRQVFLRMRSLNAGDKVALKIKRDKETKDVEVTLAPAPEANRPHSAMYGGQRENVQHQQGPGSEEYGGIYKSTDCGESWTRINSLDPRPMYFSLLRVDPSDENYLYVGGVSLYRSKDGGKTFKPDGDRGVHPDQHALWIDPKDGRHILVGCDGGYYVTYDRMEHWDHLNNMAIGQFYHVAVDSKMPYHVYGGLQDNGSWGGPSRSLSGPGPINEDWIVVSGGDGFVCRVDSQDPDLVYFESQDGNVGRRNLRTGERGIIRPRQQQGQKPYRFNWNTPFILSSHNPRILYSGGNFVFRSVKLGDELKPISPDVTRTNRGTATALSESPRNPDVLWAGTDDGYLWVTRDGGAKWTNVTEKVGLPGPRWVATIEASRYAEGRAYVVFDGHRSDDDEPYVYVTEDFGQTWKSLRANLPTGSTRALREDIQNPNLLYLGTEFAAWASIDRGKNWTKINNNLPTVAVHEFAQHPTAGEMVIATHGRSLWVLDVTALRQMTPEALKAKATLFRPNTVVRWRAEPQRGSPYGQGSKHYVGQNPPPGAQLYFALAKKPEKASLKVLDYAGKTIAELPIKAEAGIQHVAWNLAPAARQPGGLGGPAGGAVGGPGGGRQGGGRAGGGGAVAGGGGGRVGGGGGGGRAGAPQENPQAGGGPGGFPFGRFGQGVPAGTYRLVLAVDGEEFSQPLRIEADPTLPTSVLAADEAEDEWAKEEAEEKDKERGERDPRRIDR